MSNSVKVTLYVVLVAIAGISGYFALTSFGQMMDRAGDRHSDLEQIEPERRPATETPETTEPVTNEVDLASTTNQIETETNAAASALTGTDTADRLATNAVTETNRVTAPTRASPRTVPPPAEKKGGNLGLWTALFFLSVIALGLFIAHDVSHFLGNRALKTLYNDEGDGVKNPEYEKAEEVWANGDHLEAIKMMREYLAVNPREQHVAIRIAEIYEKDLKNNLAAALEYEEVLKHKLQPDRWGWAAIHLCNLYFRLNQEQKGYELLRRIINDYPNTAAAEKARKRLEQVGEVQTSEMLAPEPAPSTSPPGPKSSLPPGFRPRK